MQENITPGETEETVSVEDIEVLSIEDLKANFLSLMDSVVKQYGDNEEEASDAK